MLYWRYGRDGGCFVILSGLSRSYYLVNIIIFYIHIIFYIQYFIIFYIILYLILSRWSMFCNFEWVEPVLLPVPSSPSINWQFHTPCTPDPEIIITNINIIIIIIIIIITANVITIIFIIIIDNFTRCAPLIQESEKIDQILQLAEWFQWYFSPLPEEEHPHQSSNFISPFTLIGKYSAQPDQLLNGLKLIFDGITFTLKFRCGERARKMIWRFNTKSIGKRLKNSVTENRSKYLSSSFAFQRVLGILLNLYCLLVWFTFLEILRSSIHSKNIVENHWKCVPLNLFVWIRSEKEKFLIQMRSKAYI